MTQDNLQFRPKLQKIVELLLYMVHKRPDIDVYQAVKFLYLADKEHFNRYGRPITYETYSALVHGPVASNAYDLLKSPDRHLTRFGIEELPFKLEILDDRIIYLNSPNRAVNHDLFSKSDLKVMDHILNVYGDKTFKELRDLTHGHFAYKSAWDERNGKNSSTMRYEDMLDESSEKAPYIAEISPVSSYMA